MGAQILATAAPLPAVRERVLPLSAAESSEPGPDEQLAVEWLAGGPQAAAAGLRLPPRAVVLVRAEVVTEFRETLASIGETLAALEQRLTGIERQLGITAERRRDRRADPATGGAAAARPEAGQDRTKQWRARGRYPRGICGVIGPAQKKLLVQGCPRNVGIPS